MLVKRYGDVPQDRADVIVALGGDGFMLHTLHSTQDLPAPVYGMNRGTIGFLMNEYSETDLVERLEAAEHAEVNPLAMTATCGDGTVHHALAINEVSLLRAGPRRPSCVSPSMVACVWNRSAATVRWWRRRQVRPPITIPRMVRSCRLGRTCWP